MYEGEFEKDLPHGEGRYTFANGSVYVGEFAKGHIHGEGHFEFQEVPPLSRREHGARAPPRNCQKAFGRIRLGRHISSAHVRQAAEGALDAVRRQAPGLNRRRVTRLRFRALPFRVCRRRVDEEDACAEGGWRAQGTSYDNDEYLLPGMSIPEKLRIQSGQLAAAFVKGSFYQPTLFAPHPGLSLSPARSLALWPSLSGRRMAHAPLSLGWRRHQPACGGAACTMCVVTAMTMCEAEAPEHANDHV